MRRTLLLLAGAAVLTLPAAAAARPQTQPAPGFLVVRDASTDGAVTAHAVATVAVQGFVVGHIAEGGAVQLYHVGSTVPGQATGAGLTRRRVYYHGVHGVPGFEFSGSGFRFRAVGGVGDVWRVVVYGAGVSLYAGGEGVVHLHGSVAYPHGDGDYSVDGGRFASLPSGSVKLEFGGK